MRSTIKGYDLAPGHVPVLVNQVIKALDPGPGRIFVDGTFGAGGYSQAMLARGARVIGIDRDPEAFEAAQALENKYPRQFKAIHAAFAHMACELSALEIARVDGVTLDIGVSSMQLDQAKRGFSFMREGPLDMRMAQTGVSAYDLINRASEKALAHIFFVYGEERRARTLAKAICVARQEKLIETTVQLADLVRQTLGPGPKKHHRATKIFQALRIAVNGELEQLVHGLFAAEHMLVPGGKLAVVSFHSLEDRIVKKFLALGNKPQARSRHAPPPKIQEIAFCDVAKPVKADKEEIKANPRARSAILRAATRSSSPARKLDYKGLGLPGRLDKNTASKTPVWGDLS